MLRMTTNDHWEIRPGGMLVQKRTEEEQHRSGLNPLHIIRVRVKYGSICHEIPISSEASFGDLKKRLSGLTGLHEQEQKLLYKNKERDSKEFLDIAGVKDKSKLVLLEDPISQEKRYLEMRKRKMADESIALTSSNLDTLAGQVSALESMVSKGEKVDEKDANNLIDLLMNQLVKLDGILVQGEVELQRQMQVKRIQKYVQSVDMLKLKMENSKQEQQQRDSAEVELSQVVVTTHWETFDLL